MMTKDHNNGDQLVDDLPSNISQTFKIVLVDIQAAANNWEIRCIETPLHQGMNYVAISYRWGELTETMIDTGLGYLARVTSFDLFDFYSLCRVMLLEHDLVHSNIKYVWVDTLCVDQTNYARRIATIYHMNSIYERANYIVAVPDLHLTHLKNTSTRSSDIILKSALHGHYIYHLLHGNMDALVQFDIDLYDAIPSGKVVTLNADRGSPVVAQWTERITRRSGRLQDIIEFFMDILRDWSTRVWVISEYHIAKRKESKKMKYWFLQLGRFESPLAFFEFDFAGPPTSPSEITTVLPNYAKTSKPFADAMEIAELACRWFHSTMVGQLNEQTFLEMMLKSKASRNEDRFFAILPLSSKYKYLLGRRKTETAAGTTLSVRLKLFEWMDTKDKLELLYLSNNLHFPRTNRNLVLPTFATTEINWANVGSYQEIVEYKKPNGATFLQIYREFQHPSHHWNFDMSSSHPPSVQLILPSTATNMLYQLRLHPKEYYKRIYDPGEKCDGRFLLEKTQICQRLQLPTTQPLTTLLIPFYDHSIMDIWLAKNGTPWTPLVLIIIGSFEKNIWTFSNQNDYAERKTYHWSHHYCSDEYPTGFYVY